MNRMSENRQLMKCGEINPRVVRLPSGTSPGLVTDMPRADAGEPEKYLLRRIHWQVHRRFTSVSDSRDDKTHLFGHLAKEGEPFL